VYYAIFLFLRLFVAVLLCCTSVHRAKNAARNRASNGIRKGGKLENKYFNYRWKHLRFNMGGVRTVLSNVRGLRSVRMVLYVRTILLDVCGQVRAGRGGLLGLN
jgi:hypothetical protein